MQLLPEIVVFLSHGRWLTLLLTFFGVWVALPLALLSGWARLTPWRWVRGVALTYIEVFRGTSALVQLFWFFFVLPFWGISLDPFLTGILVLGLNAGAYGGEIVRAAVLAVPHPQRQAAAALNFSPSQTWWRIVLPQAIPLMIPPLGNLLIELLKNTSLVSLITLSELAFQGQVINARLLRPTLIFTCVLLLYFIVGQIIALSMRFLEQRFRYQK